MTTEEILTAVSKMTALELSDLVKAIEEKFGVSAAAPVAVVAAAGPAVEEQTEFDVILVDIGASKINVIKAVRTITGLGLGEAKALAETAGAKVKEGISKEEAEKAKKELEDAGAKVEIK